MAFEGTYMDLGNLMKLSSATTRSITGENVYGEPGEGEPEVEEVVDPPHRPGQGGGPEGQEEEKEEDRGDHDPAFLCPRPCMT